MIIAGAFLATTSRWILACGCKLLSRSCAAPNSQKTSQRRSRCPQLIPRHGESSSICMNVAKHSTRLASTISTKTHPVTSASFHRQSRPGEIFVDIVDRGPRKVRPPEGSLLTDSKASQLSRSPQSCKTTAYRGKLKPQNKRIRRPRSRERGCAIALRDSVFRHGPVRTQRANPRCKRPG